MVPRAGLADIQSKSLISLAAIGGPVRICAPVLCLSARGLRLQRDSQLRNRTGASGRADRQHIKHFETYMSVRRSDASAACGDVGGARNPDASSTTSGLPPAARHAAELNGKELSAWLEVFRDRQVSAVLDQRSSCENRYPHSSSVSSSLPSSASPDRAKMALCSLMSAKKPGTVPIPERSIASSMATI
jgi:hypothetical protein